MGNYGWGRMIRLGMVVDACRRSCDGTRILLQLLRLSLLLSVLVVWRGHSWTEAVLVDDFTLPAPEFPDRLLSDVVVSQGLQADRDTLLQWKEHWILSPNQNPNATSYLETWNESDPSPCGWQGIVCGPYGAAQTSRVTVVKILNVELTGTLPMDGYGNLTACTRLTIAGNLINGTIPIDIAEMPSLQYLDLSENFLTGGIPDAFVSLSTNLVSLNLSKNLLTDPIPPSLFTTCTNLVSLNLSLNSMAGNFPAVWNCQALRRIDLWKNHLTGSMPAELGLLGNLTALVLSETHIGGPFPLEFLGPNCGNLLSLQLARMHLSGPIPKEFSNCPNLRLINIQSNNFTGTIPPEIGNLPHLSCFAVGNNSIEGPLPSELSKLANLKYLDLSLNQISGTIPETFVDLISLAYIALQENSLSGVFPMVVTNIISLQLLDLSHNQLTGTIPPEVGRCTNLTSLFLAYNTFSGFIPTEVGLLAKLQVLDFSYNQLSGMIPPSIGQLKSLLLLQLSHNDFTGTIPPELGNCSSLLWLNLGWNGLTGTIPSSFDSMGLSALETFMLNRNFLPLVPAEMGECGALERWLPGYFEPYSFLVYNLAQQGRVCRVWWNLLLKGQLHPAELDTPLAFIQLASNKLSGSIPKNIGIGGKFSNLFFDHNRLIGPIPDTLDLIPLYNLNFSNNKISGEIPKTLGLARHLLSMDLSFNELSGRIPDSLGNLTFMTDFNVSYNNLSGPVPQNNQFATYSFSVYEGNPYLCYAGSPYAANNDDTKLQLCSALNASPPPLLSRASNELSTGAILGICIGSAVLMILFAGCVFCCFVSRAGQRQQTSSDPKLFKKVRRDRFHSSRDLLKIPVSAFGTDSLPKALSYVDLIVATNNFDDSNIIGDGGFGVVFKAKLADGSVVAIKKLIQDGAQGDREFAAEMLTLGSIRHENLVPLLGYCASDGEKLLVYKCMTNGSLEEWLHDRPGGKEVLTWGKRLNIAAGSARGLAFLHHSCAPVIIHRDMKASNILLDDNFCACVTDFGLARRMYGQDTHVSTIVAGTLGYVPPEYSQTWRSTTKGDVYSFGVVLLELITGRRPTGDDFEDEDGTFLGGNVIEWVRSLLSKRRHEESYDPILKSSGAAQELFQFLKLAAVCTDDLPSNRPAMSDVTKALDQIELSLSKRSPSQAFL